MKEMNEAHKKVIAQRIEELNDEIRIQENCILHLCGEMSIRHKILTDARNEVSSMLPGSDKTYQSQGAQACSRL